MKAKIFFLVALAAIVLSGCEPDQSKDTTLLPGGWEITQKSTNYYSNGEKDSTVVETYKHNEWCIFFSDSIIDNYTYNDGWQRIYKEFEISYFTSNDWHGMCLFVFVNPADSSAPKLSEEDLYYQLTVKKLTKDAMIITDHTGIGWNSTYYLRRQNELPLPNSKITAL